MFMLVGLLAALTQGLTGTSGSTPACVEGKIGGVSTSALEAATRSALARVNKFVGADPKLFSNGQILAAPAKIGPSGHYVAVYINAESVCGTAGCPLLILQSKENKAVLFSRISPVQMPVYILETNHHGFRDLAVTVAGGGAQRRTVKVSFGARAYNSNPTMGTLTSVDTASNSSILLGQKNVADKACLLK